MKKERISGFDFERMVLACGIVLYHYLIHTAGIGLTMLNGHCAIGQIITSTFFLLSGAMLFYNYGRVQSLLTFYWKRFKTIFPAFWIAYFMVFVHNAINRGSIFLPGVPKWKLLLSVCGMDGYFSYRGYGDYYLLGEWFLGVIILLYLLYPLLAYLLEKYAVITSIGIAILYLLFVFNVDKFKIQANRNLIFCLTCFYLGMVIMKYKALLFDSKGAVIACIGIGILNTILCYFFNNVSLLLIYAVAFYLLLQKIGVLIEKVKLFEKITSFIGGISYEIFLVQHVLMLDFVTAIFMPRNKVELLEIFGVVLFLTILFAKLLHSTVVGLFVKTKQA